METNAPPIDDPAWPVDNWTLSVSLEEQAGYLLQAFALALSGLGCDTSLVEPPVQIADTCAAFVYTGTPSDSWHTT